MDEEEEDKIAEDNAEINESYEDNATPNIAATVIAVMIGFVGTIGALLYYAQYEQQANPYATSFSPIIYIWLIVSLVGAAYLLLKSKRPGENYFSSPWFRHYDYSIGFYVGIFLLVSFFVTMRLVLSLS
jgi:hypothetical protein